MVGKALTAALLERGYNVIILSRSAAHPVLPKNEKLFYSDWDIEKQIIDKDAITKADYIVHLAGASIAEKRWTTRRKNEIVNSRVQSTALLVKAISELPHHIKAVISASAIGWYGDDERSDGRPFIETDPADESFLGVTCMEWERSVDPLSLMGIRVVKLRIGIVLSNQGGALKEFKKPLRYGIAAILGNGRQVISWIHIDDLVRVIMFAMEMNEIQGIFNAVAPKPVTNKDLVLSMAQTVRGKFHVPLHVPSIVLKIYLGVMSSEVLKSTTVSSKKIEEAGFIFQYPVVKLALRSLR